jgi:protein phosphatase
MKASVSADIFSVEIGFASDVGLSREVNEDSLGVLRLQSTDPIEGKRVMLVVADGMGGHAKGEVASKLAVERMLKGVTRRLTGSEKGTLPDVLGEVAEATNKMTHEYSVEHPECSGMGTTLTACLVDGSTIYGVHIGDSRAYLVGSKGIRKLTTDHTWVQQMVERGDLTEEQARVHPFRNVITKVVGTHPEIEPDVLVESVEDDQLLLLCSDGITGHLSGEEMLELAGSSHNPQEACDRMIRKSLYRGGADNLTVVIAPVPMVD